MTEPFDITKLGQPRTPVRIVVTEEHKVNLAIDHLRSARDLLKEAHAFKSVERVRAALKSADGARRHAKSKGNST